MYHDIADSTIPYPNYPNHRRIPNPVVRGLYKIGYFFADFGPLFINLFNVVYLNLRRLFAFFVGLLIEISTVIVLLATITFSIFHSIELLQRAGATGGQEYVGVAIFEVVFISSTALMTKALMDRRWPDWFSITGFIAGIIFVEASNISGMADNWTGWIIGGSIPIMLVISEGVLAYRALGESAKEDVTNVMDIMRRNRLTVGDVLKAIEMYLTNQKVDTGKMDIDKVDIEEVDVSKVDMSKVDRKVDIDKVDMEEVDTEQVDIARVDMEEVDTSKADKSTVDTAKEGTSKTDDQEVDITKVDIQEADKKVDDKVDMNKVDMDTVDAETVDNNKVDMAKVDTKVDTETVNTDKVDINNVDTKVDTMVLDLSKLLDRKRTNRDTLKEIERVVKYGLDIKEKEGDVPGRKRLMKEAGCKEYVAKEAKKVLDKLDKTG